MDPGQQVASTAELIDKIYSFLDLKTIFRARVVCRKWRSVSEMYLKRRLRIRDWSEWEEPMVGFTAVIYPDVQESSNLLNNTCQFWKKRPVQLTLTTWDSGRSKAKSRSGDKWRHSSAPFVAIVLDQDWTSNIDSLKLHICLTIDDLLAVQVAILKQFSSMRAFYAELLESRSTVVPLCYTELQDQSGRGDVQNESLKRFEVRGWIWNFKAKEAGSLDYLVYDLFGICPNLDTFKLGLLDSDSKRLARGDCKSKTESYFRSDMLPEDDRIETHLDFTITRNNHPNRIWDDMHVQPYWTARLISCRGNFGLALSSLMKVILSLTQLQKLLISLRHSVLAKICRNVDWFQDRLDILYLTTGYGCPLVLKALDSTTAFTNVTRLYWSIAVDSTSTTFNLDFTVGDRPTFPNVVTLQLHRDRNKSKYTEPEGGFKADIWISRNIHKMAPNVRRLIADVYNGEEAIVHNYWTTHLYVSPKDIPLMLGIVKAFEKLEELVLVNPLNYGKKWTDFSPESAAECLKGLKSMTLSIDGHQMLMEAAKYFLSVCQLESLRSITKMGLFNRRKDQHTDGAEEGVLPDDSEDSDDSIDEDPALAELRRVGVAFPDHIIVTTGSWSREMAQEAFEGLLD